MSNARRRAPAILKRRSAPRTPATAGATLLAERTKLIPRPPASTNRNADLSAPSQALIDTTAASDYFFAETVEYDSPSPVDVWELEVESESSETPARQSISTQADFPSRAFAALSHQLAESCQKVCPTLGARALRDNVIDKLIEIVNDAEESTKARFLLEQIFAYKTKMPHHSNFMTRQCKLLMDLSQKTYQHLKDVDGTGLLTLPTKGTLRSRYPETFPVAAKSEVEVLLQMEASTEGTDGTADEQAATYYYVVPSEDIMPNDLMNQ